MDKPGLSVFALLTLMLALKDEPAKLGCVTVRVDEKDKQDFVGIPKGLQTNVLPAIWPKDKDDAYLDPPQDALSSLVRMPTPTALQKELRDQLVVRFSPFQNVRGRLTRLNWLLDPKAAAAEQEAGAFLLERAKQLATNFFSGCV